MLDTSLEDLCEKVERRMTLNPNYTPNFTMPEQDAITRRLKRRQLFHDIVFGALGIISGTVLAIVLVYP
jgi:hypothetical protein